MPLKNTTEGWGVISRAFHWLTVLLILVQAVTGLFRSDLPKAAMAFHKSIGITILALALARLLWRLYAGRPADLPSVARWQNQAAHLGHWLLYLLFFIVPLSGWAMVSAGGRSLDWFGLVGLPGLVAPNEQVHEQLEGAHEWLFWLLALVAAGHAAVAVVHHLVWKDATLRRMLGRL